MKYTDTTHLIYGTEQQNYTAPHTKKK